MTTIKTLISILTNKEQKKFVTYLQHLNKRKDVRNIDLVKLVLINKEDNLKHEIGTNAFNVLNKRVTDRLMDFIASMAFENENFDEIIVIKKLLVVRKLFASSKYKLAFKILSQTEQKAIVINDYALLNEIYHTQIEYSHLSFSPDQSIIFSKYEKNLTQLLIQDKINMANAIIRKAFIDNSNHKTQINIQNLIETTYTNFKISDEDGYNFKTLYQIAEIADYKGEYQKNYHQVNLFFINKLTQIENTKLDTSKHLIYHINLLYSIANIYFRKKEFELSLSYLDKMYTQMLRDDKKYYQEKIIQHTTLKALVFNYTNQYLKSINCLDDLFLLGFNSEKLSQPILLRLIIHFQQHELSQVKLLLNKLNKSDKWYQNNISLDWLLNKKYIEILLFIELGYSDLVDSKILSLTRTYTNYFNQDKNNQVLSFLKLIKIYDQSPHLIKTNEFKEKVEQTLNWKPLQEEDIFVISFYAWLKSKMENKILYKTTIDIINQIDKS